MSQIILENNKERTFMNPISSKFYKVKKVNARENDVLNVSFNQKYEFMAENIEIKISKR